MPWRWRLDVDDDILELRKSGDQQVLDDVRGRVGVVERRLPVEPDMQVHECEVGGAPGSDLLAAEHLRDACDHQAHGLLGNDDLICENARRVLGDGPAGMADEAGDEDSCQGVEQRIPVPHTNQGTEHRDRGEDVAACMPGVGAQDLAVEAVALAHLIEHHEDIGRQCHDHDGDPLRKYSRGAAMQEAFDGRTQYLDEDDDQEDDDRDRGHRFVLPMAIGMVCIRRAPCHRHADQAARRHRARGLGQGRIGGRVVGVIEDHGDAVDLALQLKAAIGAAELGERGGDGDDLDAVAMCTRDVQRRRADRPRRAEDGDSLHASHRPEEEIEHGRRKQQRIDPVEHATWRRRHEATRWQPDVVRAWIDRYPYQFKFVVSRPADVEELEHMDRKTFNILGQQRDNLAALLNRINLSGKCMSFSDMAGLIIQFLAQKKALDWNELNAFLNKTLKTEGKDYVVAIDTDSIYLTLETLVEKTCEGKTDEQKIKFMDKVCEEVLQPFINTGYQELADYMNAYSQKMIMKREVLADKGIWTAKKRYILNVHNSEGVWFEKPKIKVMGLEMVKSSTPAVIRDKLHDSIQVILNGSQSDLQNYILEFRKEFDKLPVEDIAFPRGVNGIKQYAGSPIYAKGTPIHVRGALLFNEMLKQKKITNVAPIQDGDKIKFAYLRQPNPIHDNVIAVSGYLPSEFGIDQYIDRDLQFDKTFLEPLKSITDAIDWRPERIATLEDFFA